MHDAANDPIALHLTQLLDQHFLRVGRNRPLEIGEAQQLAAEEMEQDHQLPAALQHLEGLFDALSRRSGRVFDLTQKSVPYFFVRSCHSVSLASSFWRDNRCRQVRRRREKKDKEAPWQSI